jgi:uncharacterized protein (TIGR02246 family)
MSASDEQAIRAVVAEWIEATRRGDVDAVMRLVTDDVLFLTPGQEPMDRAAFETASRAHPTQGMQIDATSDIREVQVEGNMGFLWSRLVVNVEPPGAAAVTREGYTLTIFRKRDGRWLLARDANMLVRR